MRGCVHLFFFLSMGTRRVALNRMTLKRDLYPFVKITEERKYASFRSEDEIEVRFNFEFTYEVSFFSLKIYFKYG